MDFGSIFRLGSCVVLKDRVILDITERLVCAVLESESIGRVGGVGEARRTVGRCDGFA
jgi:hypothetical protein